MELNYLEFINESKESDRIKANIIKHSKLDLIAGGTNKIIVPKSGEEEKLKKEIEKLYPEYTVILIAPQSPRPSNFIAAYSSSANYQIFMYDASDMNNKKKQFNFKLSKGSGDGSPKAENYEMGICVAYNMSKGMDEAAAMKAAGMNANDQKVFEIFKETLLPVGENVVKEMGDVGKVLQYTGNKHQPPANVWPSKDDTPKTDILGNKTNHISLKKSGGSQLISGKLNKDAVGVLEAGLQFYDKYSNNKSSMMAKDLINDFLLKAVNVNSDRSINLVKKDILETFLKFRIPQITKEIKKNAIKISKGKAGVNAIEKHAKAELINAGLADGSFNSNNIIPGVAALTKGDIKNWYSKYKNTLSEKMKNETVAIMDGFLTNKILDENLNKLMSDTEFKKWCVYEAASGLYKFTGDIDINALNLGVANRILVFNNDGVSEFDGITADWANKYVNHVQTQIGFKSSGRNKMSAFRMIVKESKNLISEAMDEIEDDLDLLNEGLLDAFKKGVDILKNVSKKVFDIFYNLIKKITKKLNEWANNGFSYFMDKLGIDLYGFAEVNIVF